MKKLFIAAVFVVLAFISCTTQEKNKPVIMEFMSSSCSSCEKFRPVMDEVEKAYSKKIRIIVHDINTPDGAQQGTIYKIKRLPTIIFLDRNGNEYFRSGSNLTFSMIEAIIRTKTKIEPDRKKTKK